METVFLWLKIIGFAEEQMDLLLMKKTLQGIMLNTGKPVIQLQATLRSTFRY